MAIKIDTNAVRAAAAQIANTNQKISSDFSSVESAITSLNRNWEGTASDAAFRKFNNIKNTYYSNRFNAVNDMVNFMRRQVGEGYEQTEAAIASAASAFK
ncbi:MAG TPA: hypothetical protein DD413_04130 [Ruminococcus sp.]|nr:hypothetical protein [Ruminococcus sp.]